MKKQLYDESAPIIKSEQLAPHIRRLTVLAPAIAAAAKPGQFAMVRVGTGFHDPLLRRPFSLHQVSVDGSIQLLFKIVGKGTAILARQSPGERIKILGPLGRGFDFSEAAPSCLVGGGIGIAPLLFLAKTLSSRPIAKPLIVLLGARTKDELVAVDDFEALGVPVLAATDDGSFGIHGPVTKLMGGEMLAGQHWKVFCCGPLPMMKAVAGQCRAHGWECQVSLETTMVCGTGACLGCAVEIPPGSGKYVQICQKGPVFDAKEVNW